MRAAEAALGRLGAESGRVGLSGQMHGLVVLDAERQVLRPAILWNDQRTAAECAEIEERIGLERLIELTGNRALPGFTAPKLLWLRRHEPEVYERIAHVLLPKDYVRLQLFGELATDVADASGTLLFDVAGRRWSEEVLAALEIPPEWLPPVRESTEVAGAGDQAAGAVGVGVLSPGPVSVVLGTSGVVFAPLSAFRPDPEGRAHVFCHAVPGTWHAMGVMLSAAGSLSWFRKVFAPDEPIERLDAEAERWEPGAEGRPVPAVPRRGADAARRSRRARRLRRPVAPPRSRRAQASGARGRRLRPARLARAAARARLRRRGRAGLGRRRPERALARDRRLGARPAAPANRRRRGRRLRRSPARGRVADGVFTDVGEAVSACVRVRDEIEPDPEWKRVYDEGYERFRALYPALRPWRRNECPLRDPLDREDQRLVMAGARESDLVEVAAVASRDLARAEDVRA